MVSFSGIANGLIAAGQVAQVLLPFLSGARAGGKNEVGGVLCGPVALTLGSDHVLSAHNVGTTVVPTEAQVFIGNDKNNIQVMIPSNGTAALPIELDALNPQDRIVCSNAGQSEGSSTAAINDPVLLSMLAPRVNINITPVFGTINTRIPVNNNMYVQLNVDATAASLTVIGSVAIIAYTTLQIARIRYSNNSQQSVQGPIRATQTGGPSSDRDDDDAQDSSHSVTFTIPVPPTYTGALAIESLDLVLSASASDPNAYRFRDFYNQEFLKRGGVIRGRTQEEADVLAKLQ